MHPLSAKVNCTLVILLVVFSLLHINAQIGISNIKEIEKVKNGTTYIVMKDPESEKVQAFVNVIKDNWTISKIEFIRHSDMEKYLSPENSFFTISGFEKNISLNSMNSNGTMRRGGNYTVSHIYLELWTCNEKYFKRKKKKEFAEDDKIQIARIELFTDFEILMDPKKMLEVDFDGGGHIRNWGPGILKNYVQLLMKYLKKNEVNFLYDKILNEKEIKNLKREVLYIPDYVLIKFNKFSGDETERREEKDLMDEYNLKYQIITTEELNQKILTDTTKFYYLLYVKSSTEKFMNVINSLTGEIIYLSYTPISYNIDSGDFIDIERKATKK